MRVWPGELLGSLSGHTTRIAKCNTDSGVVMVMVDPWADC